MAQSTEATTPAAAKALHPVYSVSDIQRKVRVLDGTKVSYSLWVKLFELHARGYRVMKHIDGTQSPAKIDPDYESWSEIGAIVLQWIYRTLSDDILVCVLQTESTNLEAWTRFKSLFLNNNGSRATALELEFNNLTLKAMPSLESYCQKLKELSDQLNDVDFLVNNQRLVLQLVQGLPREYDMVASNINQTLPTWEVACSMLQLEHKRQSARDNLSAPTALAVVSDEPQPPKQGPIQHRRRGGNRPNNPRQAQSNSGPCSRGQIQPATNQPICPANNQPSRPTPTPPTSANRPPYWAQWAPPPCPFPIQPGLAQPWSPQQTWDNRGPNQNKRVGPSNPSSSSQAFIGEYDPLQPTQIEEAMNAISIHNGTWIRVHRIISRVIKVMAHEYPYLDRATQPYPLTPVTYT
ncbi:uncharacterized protein LOC110875414 [Helianthus annuus]|uniref:uncharacterized protein LOC110875414 n=1 Tax=Helianthus annuus TaxID=4232 RepID=UPI000B90910A|nr:uncharacterized protein LOC110875414 [Helianthus annuus]